MHAQTFSPVNPPVVSAGGATFSAISGPTAPGTPNSGSIQFEYQGLHPNVPNPDLNKTWTLNTTFDPSLAGPYSGVFEYRLDAPPLEQWVRASLSQNIIAPFAGASVTKEVCTDSSFTTCTTIGPVTDSGFTGFNPNFPAGSIFVRDTYVGVPPALLKNYINTFQTPAPLPLLGAGAALGFSRKLRSRIKAARR
ncbi:MAG: hypothetical protein ACKOOH_07400 [Cyanobium sp.]